MAETQDVKKNITVFETWTEKKPEPVFYCLSDNYYVNGEKRKDFLVELCVRFKHTSGK